MIIFTGNNSMRKEAALPGHIDIIWLLSGINHFHSCFFRFFNEQGLFNFNDVQTFAFQQIEFFDLLRIYGYLLNIYYSFPD